ncbi:PH domain-containing protein [Dawidia soli]|uniref:PH domain-containing protein n=1 Tax=Dawidia soli TaxID=2782352 RepID=A0AAP2D812_9BACT|nr:PH domain-containing protein [Dawidia soli]MBT1687148.1 PH domain-containing protein [Dawidia soli]
MNALQYPSKKGVLTGSIMAGVVLFLIGGMVLLPFHDKPIAYVLMALPIGLIAWTWFGTSYTLDATHLYFTSGPFRGKIALTDITQLTCGETMWAGYRPALARKGIVVRYGRWNEIYISPRDQEAFVAELAERNPKIAIVVKK